MSTISLNKEPKRRSLFGPLLLIGIGFFLLLNRMDIIGELHWMDVVRLWPLFLIFLGLNLIVQQAPRPAGTLFSGLVGLLAIAVFGFILLSGLPESILGRATQHNWQTRQISQPVAGVTSAVMNIEIGPPGANIYALQDSPDLIAGTVTFLNDLLFEKEGSSGLITVNVAPRNNSIWLWSPDQWDILDDGSQWELGLNPNVPLTLDLTAAAGSSRLDLRDLHLESLTLNVSAGEMTLFLPDGNYDVNLNTNAGASVIILAQSGKQEIQMEVNAGSVVIDLPAGREARVEADLAMGSINNLNGRLQQSGDANVWLTDGYATAANRVDLLLSVAVGSVEIR